MTSTTPIRIIAIALTVLALAAPAAVADTTAPAADWRHPDTTRIPEQVTPAHDWRNPDNRVPEYVPPAYQVTAAPATPKPVAATSGGGTSPFVYIVPAVVLIAMLGAGVAYARPGRPARGSVA
jgi:hypothetical protein